MRTLLFLALWSLIGCDEEGVLSKNGLVPDADGRGDTDVVPDFVPVDSGGVTPDPVDPNPFIDPGTLDPIDPPSDTHDAHTDGVESGMPSDTAPLSPDTDGIVDSDETPDTDAPSDSDAPWDSDAPGDSDAPSDSDGAFESDDPFDSDGSADSDGVGDSDGSWTADSDETGVGWDSDDVWTPDSGWTVDTDDLPVDTDGVVDASDCVIAGAIPDWLDQFQIPNDGKVVFCHRTRPNSTGGGWVVIDTNISACIAHAGHLKDRYPTTLCDS